MKTWSKSKRLKVTAAASLIILIAAVASGSLLYGISRTLNLTEKRSLKALNFKYAQSDPELMVVYLQDQQQAHCTAQTLGLTMTYLAPLKLWENSQIGECQFGLTSYRGQPPRVYLSKKETAKSLRIEQLTLSLKSPETNSLAHDQFEVTSIWGERDGRPYQAYVLASTTEQAYLVEYYPADPAGLTAVKELVKSLRSRN